jgi:hypothetical protein
MEIISDSGLARVSEVKIFEPQGDRIEITFSQSKEGVDFDPRLFDLERPELVPPASTPAPPIR